jgi:hypothetical protein
MKNRKLYVGLSALILLFSVSLIALTGSQKKQKYSERVSSKYEIPRGIQGALAYLSKIRGNALTGELKIEDVLFARSLAENFAKYKVGNSMNLQWEEMGPDNVGGRTRAILIDKRDATYNTLYAGGVAGGLWKSIDGGSNWSQVTLKNQNGTTDNTNIAISCIAQATNGSIFVGTGEGLAQFTGTNFNSGQPGGGIYRCTSGDDFMLLPATIPTAQTTGWAEVNRIACNPVNGIVYASIGNGLKISSDNGNTWTSARELISTGSTIPLSANSKDVKTAPDGTVIASVGNKLYLSADSVFSDKSKNGLPTNLSGNNDRLEIAVAPSNSDYLYAVVAKSGALLNIYRSSDKGASWTIIAPGGSTSFDLFGDNNQGWYDNVIAVFPNNPKKIVVAGIDCWKGEEYVNGAFYDFIQITDRNETVSATNPTPNPTYAHVDHHICTFHPTNPNIFYLGTDGGIFKTTNGGLTFTPMNRNYAVTQFYGLGIGPDGSAVGGTQDNSNPYVQGIQPYPKTAKVLWSGDGGWAAISQITTSLPTKQKAIFVTAQYASMARSYNNGVDWQYKSNFFTAQMQNLLASFVTPLTMWQTVTNTQIKDSVDYTSDSNNDTIGRVVAVRSKQIGYPFNYTLTAKLDSGKSVKVMDRALSRFYVGFYEALWMTNEPLNFTKKPSWFKLASVPNELISTITCSKDGNHVYFSTGSKLYRVSNLLNAADSAQLNIDASNYALNVTMIKQFSNRSITSVSVDPNNAANVVLTLGNFGETQFVFASKDALGASPTFINKTGSGLPPAPVYSSLIEMQNNGRILVGTEFGIYSVEKTSFTDFYNSNIVWAGDNVGMDRVPVFQIRQQTMSFPDEEVYTNDNGNLILSKYPGIKNTGIIYIATHGRGFWQAKDFSQVGIIEKPTVAKTAKIDISVYPNPVVDNTNFKFNLSSDDNVVISIYDMRGNVVKTINLGKKTTGSHLFNFDSSNLNKGTYLIQIISGNQKATSKFIKF